MITALKIKPCRSFLSIAAMLAGHASTLGWNTQFVGERRRDAHKEIVQGRGRLRGRREYLRFEVAGEVEDALLVVPDRHLRAHAATCHHMRAVLSSMAPRMFMHSLSTPLRKDV